MSSEAPTFELELKQLMPDWQRYELRLFPLSLDFIRTPDFTTDEIMTLEPGVSLDSRVTQRRVELQRVRGVIWYCLFTERDPMAMTRWGQVETGTLVSIRLAPALCLEFLDSDTPMSQLATFRQRINLFDASRA